MTVWKKYLQPASAQFVQEIMDQVPEEHGARAAFEIVLNRLAESVSDEVEQRLAKLQALENSGVDNWEYYDDAMESLEDEDY